MAHLIYHQYPEWKLVRNESVVSQNRRKAIQEMHEKIDKDRAETDGLSWDSQRYVNQVVPSEVVNPDSFDTFNYKYQVYARPPPVQCDPSSLAEVTDHKPGIKYNVKRVAVDKPCENQGLNCTGHRSQHPWVLTGCPNALDENRDCSENNNTPGCPCCHKSQTNLSKPCEEKSSGCRADPSLKSDSAKPVVNEHHLLKSQANNNGDTRRQKYDQGCNPVTPNNSKMDAASLEWKNACGRPRYCSSCVSTVSTSSRAVGDSKASLNLNNSREPQNSSIKSTSSKKPTEKAYIINENPIAMISVMPVRRKGKRRFYTDFTGTDHVASLLHPDDTNNSSLVNTSSNASVEIDLLPSDDIYLNKNQLSNRSCKTADRTAKYLTPQDCKTSGVCEQADILLKENTVAQNVDKKTPEKNNLCECQSLLGVTEVQSTCRNNNASSVLEKKHKYNLTCRPIKACKNQDSCSVSKKILCRPVKPKQNLPQDKPMLCYRDLKCKDNEPYSEDKHGPLECRVVPRCARNGIADLKDPLVICEPKRRPKTPEIGYGTYKIVGSLQYRQPPPANLLSDLHLPPHMSEYQEFIRRCPKYQVGRYDRSNPANEMLLPCNKVTELLKSTRSPFIYARNPNAGIKSPMFHKLPNVDLCWKLPAFLDKNK